MLLDLEPVMRLAVLWVLLLTAAVVLACSGATDSKPDDSAGFDSVYELGLPSNAGDTSIDSAELIGLDSEVITGACINGSPDPYAAKFSGRCQGMTGCIYLDPDYTNCEIPVQCSVCRDGVCIAVASIDCPAIPTSDVIESTSDIGQTGQPLHCSSDEDCPASGPCTVGFCDRTLSPYLCASTPQPNGAECDDGNVCTVSDVCVSGSCTGMLVSCDDGDHCTEDQCDPYKGCLHVVTDPICGGCKLDQECSTSDFCAIGKCNGGKCNYMVIDCDDGNACTIDTCRPGLACDFQPAPPCDDGNPCTSDWCDSAWGCVFAAIPGC